MDRSLRRNRQQSKDILTANPEETQALLDLLFVATKENNAQCARLLGINRKTWQKWNVEPPTAWYWPLVIRAAIKHTLSSMVAHRRGTTMKWKRYILETLSRIPQSKDFEEEIANMAYDIRGAQQHLRDLLARRGMFWSNIQTTANSGGYSKATLRKAAKALGVIKTQEGYGEDKDSFWRLPNEDED